MLCPTALCHKSFLLLLCIVLTNGCSIAVNSHQQKIPMMEAYLAGNNDFVGSFISEKLEKPGWFNNSAVNTVDELMWRLEAGSFYFHLGKFQECIEQLKQAEELINDYDERAKISIRDTGAELGAAVTNMNVLPYRGYCRDRLVLSIYKSLAYLGMEKQDAARAQLKRLRNEQKKVQEDHRDFFEQESREIEKQRKKHGDLVARAEENFKNSYRAENQSYSSAVQQAGAVAHKGYGNVLNPAAIFLSGLGNIYDDNFENARIDFKRLYEAMPQNPMICRYYTTILRKTGREVPSGLDSFTSYPFPLNRNCAYVLFANGRSAAFQEYAVSGAVMTAWPVCTFYPAPYRHLNVVSGNQVYTTTILANMDAVLAQEFEERFPGIITRIIINTMIKEAAYYTSLALIQNSDMDDTAKQLTLAAAAIGGTGYRAVMNTADTRSWEILPKEFQLTQIPIPEDRTLELQLNGKRDHNIQLKIPRDFDSVILFVNAPGQENISCHVLPLKRRSMENEN